MPLNKHTHSLSSPLQVHHKLKPPPWRKQETTDKLPAEGPHPGTQKDKAVSCPHVPVCTLSTCMSCGVAVGSPLRWWIHGDRCLDQPGHGNVGTSYGAATPTTHLLRLPTEINTFQQMRPLMRLMCLWLMWIWIKESSALSAIHTGSRQQWYFITRSM